MEPLLGRPAIKALQLLGIIERTRTGRRQRRKSAGYQGAWENAKSVQNSAPRACQPFSIATPCRPPLPMTEKVQAERKGMQGENIIRSVTTPVDWYAPIVIMPKSSWSVQIWMNPIKLNEIVRLENFPLPKTVQLLAQLSWAMIFRKLDCNGRFYTAERAFTGTLSICHSVQALLLQTTSFQDQYRTWCFPQGDQLHPDGNSRGCLRHWRHPFQLENPKGNMMPD